MNNKYHAISIIQEGLPIKWCHNIGFTWLGLAFLPFSWSNNPIKRAMISLFVLLKPPNGNSMIHRGVHRVSIPNLCWSKRKNHVKPSCFPMETSILYQKVSYSHGFTSFTIQKMRTLPTRWLHPYRSSNGCVVSLPRVQEIVGRALEAAEEGVCHIELASEDPYIRKFGMILGWYWD